MAIVKTASCLVFAGWIGASAAQFSTRHEHLYKSCRGIMTADDSGIRFSGPKHNFAWSYDDIQQLQLEPEPARLGGREHRATRVANSAGHRPL